MEGVAALDMDLPPPALAHAAQVVDASISESVFNMLDAAITEVAEAGLVRGPSGSTISGGR